MSRINEQVTGLKGIRVLDFTWAGAGPFATEILCLLGADVVKVESADRPDLLRVANRAYGWGDMNVDASPCFNDMNAGKRSISLDLKNPAGRSAALKLAARADIVCDNMRAGKMEALGLGYEQLKVVKPDIICCSVSATGRARATETPDVPGYAPVFWAEGGGAAVTGMRGGDPVYLRAPVDMNAATLAALGMLAALFRRGQTGQGARIDCSAIETVSMMVGDGLLARSLGLASQGLEGNSRAPYAPNDVFPCAGDDEWIAISVETTAQWESLCGVLAPELLGDRSLSSRLARWENADAIYQKLRAATRSWEAGTLAAALDERGVSAVKCPSVAELLENGNLIARGFWKQVDHPLIGRQTVGALPFRLNPAVRERSQGGPILGADTDAVMVEWLGTSGYELESLRGAGAFGQAVVAGG
ncbi:CoA transferase [Pigmentiphaga sp. H8]|uniref:CaiB/BaiF CoA transferase family protein n=1 Tax=Pigmentiphaga sp. H8 TaxID=2488560 RepID=UPI000F5AE5FC|nr:CoA transferase [Pigmentiphaga sp. H8]AZG08249.1 CoA transferase [Pigmentiphaga sp. H8]